MAHRNRVVLALLAASICLPVPGAGAAGRRPDAEMTLAEARDYMVELINRDRSTRGLKPVQLDATATAAGQKHAEEMAAQVYMAHWNREGKLPDQRYTEQGGINGVSENVYLEMHYAGDSVPSGPLRLQTDPTFTRQEIEAIEAAYFNETPPDDGHRRNILDPNHTHVGIALARAREGYSRTVANTQEFENVAVAADRIPAETAVGDEITVSGRVLAGARFRAVSAARAAFPTPMPRDALRATDGYRTPSAYTTFWPAGYVTAREVRLSPDGRFSVRIPLSDHDRPGLYYVTIWVRAENGLRDFVASQRTVLVHDRAPKAATAGGATGGDARPAGGDARPTGEPTGTGRR